MPCWCVCVWFLWLILYCIIALCCFVLFLYETNRVKRKGATPPHRAERVVRDLQSGLIAATSSPRSSMVPQMKHHHHTAHSSGTGSKQRRRRNSSDDSHEHLANLIPSPHLHARLTKVQFQLAARKNKPCKQILMPYKSPKGKQKTCFQLELFLFSCKQRKDKKEGVSSVFIKAWSSRSLQTD